MSQTLFGSNSTPSLPLLDANFTDLYDLREMVKSTGYTGPSAQKFDATSGQWLLIGSGVGLGYGTGSGGTVTQATSKSTAVTLNKSNGQISMNAAALAASTTVRFTLVSSVIAASDVIAVCVGGGVALSDNYQVTVGFVQAGSCQICLRNVSAGSLSEAASINFAVIKAVTS